MPEVCPRDGRPCDLCEGRCEKPMPSEKPKDHRLSWDGEVAREKLRKMNEHQTVNTKADSGQGTGHYVDGVGPTTVESAEGFVDAVRDRDRWGLEASGYYAGFKDLMSREAFVAFTRERDAAIRAEERAKWEAECSALASNQCHDGYGDEYGNHRCREVDAIRAEERAAAVEQIENLSGMLADLQGIHARELQRQEVLLRDKARRIWKHGFHEGKAGLCGPTESELDAIMAEHFDGEGESDA